MITIYTASSAQLEFMSKNKKTEGPFVQRKAAASGQASAAKSFWGANESTLVLAEALEGEKLSSGFMTEYISKMAMFFLANYDVKQTAFRQLTSGVVSTIKFDDLFKDGGIKFREKLEAFIKSSLVNYETRVRSLIEVRRDIFENENIEFVNRAMLTAAYLYKNAKGESKAYYYQRGSSLITHFSTEANKNSFYFDIQEKNHEDTTQNKQLIQFAVPNNLEVNTESILGRSFEIKQNDIVMIASGELYDTLFSSIITYCVNYVIMAQQEAHFRKIETKLDANTILDPVLEQYINFFKLESNDPNKKIFDAYRDFQKRLGEVRIKGNIDVKAKIQSLINARNGLKNALIKENVVKEVIPEKQKDVQDPELVGQIGEMDDLFKIEDLGDVIDGSDEENLLESPVDMFDGMSNIDDLLPDANLKEINNDVYNYEFRDLIKAIKGVTTLKKQREDIRAYYDKKTAGQTKAKGPSNIGRGFASDLIGSIKVQNQFSSALVTSSKKVGFQDVKPEGVSNRQPLGSHSKKNGVDLSKMNKNTQSKIGAGSQLKASAGKLGINRTLNNNSSMANINEQKKQVAFIQEKPELVPEPAPKPTLSNPLVDFSHFFKRCDIYDLIYDSLNLSNELSTCVKDAMKKTFPFSKDASNLLDEFVDPEFISSALTSFLVKFSESQGAKIYPKTVKAIMDINITVEDFEQFHKKIDNVSVLTGFVIDKDKEVLAELEDIQTGIEQVFNNELKLDMKAWVDHKFGPQKV